MSVLTLVVSGLSITALTAAIDVAPTAIGPPGHTYTDTGEAGGPRRDVPIPRAAFENVRPSCPPPFATALASISATGGTVTEITLAGVTYRRHVFTSDGTFAVTDAAPGARIEVLAVGGGGGGGKRHGGGGGAGGLVLATRTVSAGQTFAVTVGAGGEGGGTGSTPSAATNGGDSTFGEAPLQLLARGGGRGASFNSPTGSTPGQGGSGGGAQRSAGNDPGATAMQPGTNRCTTFDAGHAGGATALTMWPGGGGGGAGGPGGTVGQGSGQVGGVGLDLSGRFGTDVGASGWFAGGGGGAPADAGTFAGGQGGGGTGQGSNTAGGAGAAGTGGGGGGARSTDANTNVRGGAGGSGVVIVRYRLLPGPVRDVIAGEADSSAVVRWRVPATNPPTADTSYRVERQPVGDDAWTDVTASTTFTTVGSGADRQVRATLPVGTDARHRFRITPLLGAEEGEPTVVESLGKGGSEVQLVGTDVVHVFGETGEGQGFELSASRSVRYLIVAGGAGGASGRGGGGGGAGGVLSGTWSLGADTHPVTVGAGGAGGASASAGVNGEGSALRDRTAVGGGAGNFCGGGGAAGDCDGRAGGSGGGTRHNSGRPGGPGTPGQGNSGASGLRDGVVGGGGGGAGGQGTTGTTSASTTGRGGPGIQDDITGSFVWYAAGGGGGGTDDRVSGLENGGEGGGGRGARDTEGGQDATSRGSGGGGGGSAESQPGGRGADGIVIVRYAFLEEP